VVAGVGLDRAGLDAEHGDGGATDAAVPGDRAARVGHVGPALEDGSVAVDHGTHHVAHAEGLLAARVRALVEHLADGRERLGVGVAVRRDVAVQWVARGDHGGTRVTTAAAQ
jgi:hypothetical protein